MSRRRTMSLVSATSAKSDSEYVADEDEHIVTDKPKQCCRKPFISKILKLNMPEIRWIILGCTTSMIFGAITPVNDAFFKLMFRSLLIVCIV